MAARRCLACEKRVPKRGRRRCPECGHAFKGSGWDGVDAHWRARHLDRMPYAQFWEALCPAHREGKPLQCPSCRKGIPRSRSWPCQCPECAQVFRGRAWEGIEAHWQAHHPDVMPYQDFLASLCPAHRRAGDRTSGYLPFS